ncbi:hypothetical protein [Winogradskyella psychrotolerans]|uniref:hypothetical protein n=1 Tax=Winogradskyella psychrotolerans TaxID=1344585 RepID=UPI001C06E2EC|nr:hypothetical protein [Winogradskyella psychrotolerans]MBU2930254.1 hypothetical protein [Winogradskyella psychrotolerans]
METIKSNLGKGGLLLAVMGIMSIILSVFNYNIRLLAWVDAWGNTMGWIIRILLIVVGGSLFLFFGSNLDLDFDVDKL